MQNTKKKELENENPQLHASQDVETNLANGIDDEMPDPDDIPGGFSSTMQERPDILQSDENAEEQAIKDKPSMIQK